MSTTQASQAELPSDEVAHAAIQLQYTVTSTASIAAATPLLPSPTPKPIAAVSSPLPPTAADGTTNPYPETKAVNETLNR